MEKTFDEKIQAVASAYYNRYDEDANPEILQQVFKSHDMSGALALAVAGGDVEIKTDEAKGWIEETYKVLDAIFNFSDIEDETPEEDSEESTEEEPTLG